MLRILSLITAWVSCCVCAAEPSLPAGWSRFGSQGPGSVAEIIADEPAPGGGPAVRLYAPEGGGAVGVWANTVLIQEPGSPVEAELLVRSTQAGRVLTVIFYTDPQDATHWYMTRLVPLTTSWVRQRLVVHAPLGAEWIGRPLKLRLSVSEGDALVAGVNLTPAPATAAAGSQRRNLLANPGFDIGGGGWFLQAWPPQADTVELPAQTREAPDSGPWAMHLPGGGASVISTLVPFTPGRPYTLSLRMRATPGTEPSGQAARFFLITPNWKIAQGVIAAAELSSSWKRFSLIFREGDQGSPYANALYARIDPTASVDIDSLQLEEGEVATAYAPGIQLGLEPPGDGGFLAPGPATLTAVIGLPDGASDPLHLTLRGIDIRGEVLYEHTMAIAAGPDQRRSLQVPVDHQRQGVVACRLSLTGPSEMVLAETEARYAVFSGDLAANPLVGMDALPLRDGLPLLRRSEAIAQRLGFGFRRSFYHLHEGGGPDPHLTFARSAFAEQRRVGKRNMLVIDPAADSSFNLARMRAKGVAPNEEEFARDLPRFVSAFVEVAQAMNGVVDEIELLNEPNIWTVRGNAVMPPARYVQVLKAVRPALQAAAPTMRLALNVSGIDTAYVGAIAKLGGLKLVDLVTVHAYRATPEHPPIATDLARLRSLLDQHVPGMPIVNSEQYYGLLAHGIAQGEYDRNYCGENEIDITGRTVQTVLHGLTVGAPFGLLTHGSGMCLHTPFGTPWLYHSASGLRTIASLAQGVTRGHDVPVHDAVRALQFARTDGSWLVSVTTRVFGEQGTMGRPASCALFDVDGNLLEQAEVPVDYLPIYLLFPVGMTSEAVTRAVQAVAWRGFSFPLELAASRSEEGQVRVSARNRERQPLRATVRWTATPEAEPWRIELPAAGSADLLLPAGDVRWHDDPDIPYEVACGETFDAGRLRIPVLLIPSLSGVDPASWEPSSWLSLGEDHLSTDFAPERPHTGPSDLAARIALAWSADGLHLLARVDDDRVVPGPNRNSDAWTYDSLQLYIDQRASARSPRSLPDGGCTAWILGQNPTGAGFAWLELAPTGRFVGEANATTGLDPLPNVSWKPLTSGWECRATFPPAALAAMDFHAGSVFGLSLLINDHDGQGRKRGLTLGPLNSEPFAKPWLWKRCQLGK